MSTTIDSKVVEMKFDNGNFERNVQTSLSTLDKLKNSLNFKGASKFADEISNGAKNVNLSPISNAVETVKVKFSMLEVAVATVFANMVNSAINAGKNIVKALTIDPIYTGYQEYEQKMNSVQTIMNSTGEELQTVMRYLEELNKYADDTIYSFSDMTQNIGKFTNAGVKLEDAVLAIKGISNEAAVSGANAQQASHAMYNFAQALSAGYVKLIDWKSIENANMATKEFKEELLKTAVAVGTVSETTSGMYKVLTENNRGKTMSEAIDATHNFNESLSYQWMTTEVLVETLKKYSDATTDIGKKAYASAQDIKTFKQLFDTLTEAAQSGWAVTWELIIGDFDEAKETLTEISKIFSGILDKISNTRNNLLKGSLSDGWKQLRNQVNDVGIETDKFQNSLITTAKKHGIAIDDLIKKYGSFEKSLENGWLTADIFSESLTGFVGSASKVTASTKEMNEKLSAFQSTVKKIWSSDFFTLDEKIQQLADAGYKYSDVQDLITLTLKDQKIKLEDLTQSQKEALGFTQGQATAIKNLADEAKKADSPLSNLFDRLNKPSGRELLFDSLKNALRGIIDLAKAVGGAFSEIFPAPTADRIYGIIESINKFSQKLRVSSETADKVKRTFKGLFAILDLIGSVIKGVITTAFKVFGVRVSNVSDGILTLTAKIGDNIVKFRDWVKEHDHIESFFSKLGDIVNKFIDVLKRLKDRLSESEMFQTFVNSLKKLKDSALDKITSLFSNAGDSVGTFIEKLKILTNLSGKDLLGVFSNYIYEISQKFSGLDTILDRVRGSFGRFSKGISDNASDSSAGVAGAVAQLDKNIQTYGNKSIGVFERISDFYNNAVIKIRSVRFDIKNFFSEFANHISESQKITERASQVMAFILGFSLVSALNNFTKAVNNSFIGTIKSAFGSIKGAFDAVKSTLVEYQKQLRAKKLTAIAKAIRAFAEAIIILVGAIYLISKIREDGDIWKSVAVLGALAAGLTVAVGALTIISGSKKLESDMVGLSASMISFSAAILILVEALREVDKLATDGEKIKYDLGILALLAMGMATVLSAMNKNIKASGIKSAIGSAIQMLAFVGSLKLLVELLQEIDAMEPKHLIQSLLIFGGIFIALRSTIKQLGKIQNPSGMVTFLGIVISLKILISALDDIAKFDGSAVLNNLEGLGVVVGAIAVLMLSTRLAGKNSAKAGVSILLISVAMKMLVSVIKSLSEFDESSLEKGKKAIGAFTAMFALLIGISKLSGGESMKAGAMLIMASGAMLILSGVIKILGDMDRTALAQATAAVSVLGIIFAAMIGLSKNAAEVKTGPFVSMAVAIGILSVALVALTLIDNPTGLAVATAALSSVMGMFSLMIAMTKFAGETKKVIAVLTTLTIITGLLAGLLYGLTVLTKDAPVGKLIETAGSISLLIVALSSSMFLIGKAKKPDEGVLSSVWIMTGVLAVIGVLVTALNKFTDKAFPIETALSMGILLDALALSMRILGGLGDIKISGSVLGMLGIMAGVLAEIAAIVGILGSLNEGQGVTMSIGTATAMSELLVALALSMRILGGLGGMTLNSGIVSAFAVMGLALAEIAAIIVVLNKFDATELPIETAASMSLLLIALAVVCDILAPMGAIAGAAVIGAAALDGVIAVIGGLIVGLGALNKDGKLEELLNRGIPVLIKVAEGIGGFIGTLISSVFTSAVENFLAKLPIFSMYLTSFVIGLKPFLQGMSTEEVAPALESTKKLVEIILLITGAKLMDAITKLFVMENPLDYFTKSATKIAEAMVDFSNKISEGNFDVQKATAAAECAKAIAALLTALPKEGGLIQKIFGSTEDLSKFGTGLTSIGEGIKAFAESISGANINVSQFKNAAEAAGYIADLESGLTKHGGVYAVLMGDTDLFTFGANLKQFASDLVDFADTIAKSSNIKPNKFKEVADAAGHLSELDANLKPHGGLLQKALGDATIQSFGANLKQFGTDIAEFSKSISAEGVSIDPEKFKSVSAATLEIVKIENALSPEGGVAQWFTGTKDIANFGTNLVSFGTNLATFSTNIAGIDSSKIESAANATYLLAISFSVLDEIGVSTFNTTLSNFGTKLVEFGGNLSSYNGSVANINIEKIKSVTSEVKNIATALSEINKIDPATIDAFAKGINSLAQIKIDDFMKPFAEAKTKVAQAATDILNSFLNSLNSNQTNFTTAGQNLISKVISGMESNSESISAKMSQLTDKALTAIKNKYKEYEASGKEAIVKFIGGMKEESTNVEQASTAIANDAIPKPTNSEAYYGAGVQVVAGFVNGINSGTRSGSSSAYNAGYRLAQDAVQGINDGAQIHSPSKEAEKSGIFIGKGLVVGVNKYGRYVEDAGVKLGDSAIRGLNDAISRISDVIENDIDTQPRIRPVLDLSDIESNTKTLNAMISRTRALSISTSVNGSRANELQNENVDKPSSGDTYSFVQNNYSPKALSRVEIYRQTKNQFAMLKGRTK